MQIHACTVEGAAQTNFSVSMVELDHQRSAAKTLVNKVRLNT